MNREIKFRAWNRHLGRMLKDEFYVAHDGDVYQHESHPDHDLEVVDELILMQFTGLHDKNGKDIYEGDVIEMEEPVMESDMIRCAVVFDEGSFSARWDRQSQTTFFPLSQCGIEDENVEIIGNIYENPDLLK